MLFHIEQNIDYETILKEALDQKDYENFVDPKDGTIVTQWKIKKTNNGYSKKISNYYENFLESKECKPRFYIQQKNWSLPFHKDRGTLCSINYVLSNTDDKVTFKSFEESYRCALLNVQEEHSVTNLKEDRLLFKVSIFDKTYNEVLQILKTKKLEFINPR
jgi:hypothetical protein